MLYIDTIKIPTEQVINFKRTGHEIKEIVVETAYFRESITEHNKQSYVLSLQGLLQADRDVLYKLLGKKYVENVKVSFSSSVEGYIKKSDRQLWAMLYVNFPGLSDNLDTSINRYSMEIPFYEYVKPAEMI